MALALHRTHRPRRTQNKSGRTCWPDMFRWIRHRRGRTGICCFAPSIIGLAVVSAVNRLVCHSAYSPTFSPMGGMLVGIGNWSPQPWNVRGMALLTRIARQSGRAGRSAARPVEEHERLQGLANTFVVSRYAGDGGLV